MEMFDLLVVGSGPSGVMASMTAAREGLSVLLLDKKKMEYIGDKNCGDAIDAKNIDLLKENMQLEEPNGEELSEKISKITIVAGDLKSKVTAVQSPGYQVDRWKYGQRLLKLALEAGVTLRDECTVTEVIAENEFVVGVKYKSKKHGDGEVRAKVTVDSSGYTAKVRKGIPKSMTLGIDLTLPDKYTIATYREIVKLNDGKDHDFREEIVWIYEFGIDPPGYTWIFTKGKGELNLGICWVKSIPYPDGKSLKDLYHQYLDKYFHPSEYTVIKKGGGNIPMRPNFDSLVFNGVILTGDAGCLPDPTTFEGHGPALESGRLAGLTASKAIKKGCYSYRDLWEYNKEINRFMGSVHAQSFLTGRLITAEGIENVKFLLDKGIINEDELVTQYQDENAQFTVGQKIKKLFQAFPRWGLMLRVAKAISKIDTIGEIYKEYPENPDDLDSWIERRNSHMII
ncbi:MAG: NAD(P)/FAD-dependent oxidoreductase [Candidatus Heimdallarchaeota archaeon]|nr:NAD(P)/FAD-dependent oxidoreductase [Candidatus Heimdallarchaeota archaeon]